MIEIIVNSRCTSCMACVRVCPNDVYDRNETGDLPVIARREDCCSCYLCEAYCQTDALYVSPDAQPEPALDVERLIASGRLGSFRRALGWDERPRGAGRPAPAIARFPAPGGRSANHRAVSYAIGGENEGHRHTPFDARAAAELPQRAGSPSAPPDLFAREEPHDVQPS